MNFKDLMDEDLDLLFDPKEIGEKVIFEGNEIVVVKSSETFRTKYKGKAEQMGMEDLSPELKSSVDELKKAAQEVQRPYAQKATETSEVSAGSTTSTAEPSTTADKKAE